MSQELQERWKKVKRSHNVGEDSRLLLPYFRESGDPENWPVHGLKFGQKSGPNRTWLLHKITFDPQLFVQFGYTVKEFEFILPLYIGISYVSFIPSVIQANNMPLTFALMRTYSKYGACCLFEEGTSPRDILEEMQGKLTEKGIVSCYIPRVDFQEMVRHGIIPCPILNFYNEHSFSDVLKYHEEGMPSKEIEYWTGVEDADEYLCSVGIWSFVSLDYVERFAVTGDSYPSLLTYPHLLYSSRRPKTEMKLFRTPVSHTYTDLSQLPEKSIAVTRYARGMSKGKFHDERPENICGYFFYSEPESTTFLTYNRSFTAFNKTEAANEFLKELALFDDKRAIHDELEMTLESLMFNENTPQYHTIREHMRGKLPADLRFDVDMAEDSLLHEGHFDSAELTTPTRKVYLDCDLYAYDDDLDQPLCVAASALGYDLVILTHMVGSNQVVTEVLDTRHDSMKYLYFKL